MLLQDGGVRLSTQQPAAAGACVAGAGVLPPAASGVTGRSGPQWGPTVAPAAPGAMLKFVRFDDLAAEDKVTQDEEVGPGEGETGELDVILPTGPVSFEVELQSDAPRGALARQPLL